jgi:hypothetical protein
MLGLKQKKRAWAPRLSSDMLLTYGTPILGEATTGG